jgi:hypothetical protein
MAKDSIHNAFNSPLSSSTPVHALAGAYEANGQVKEAVVLLEQVVKIRETTLADDHPDWLVSERALSYFLQQIRF